MAYTPATPQKGMTEDRATLDLEWVRQMIAQAQSSRFYGKITLNFEHGRITRAVNERSLKPPHAGDSD